MPANFDASFCDRSRLSRQALSRRPSVIVDSDSNRERSRQAQTFTNAIIGPISLPGVIDLAEAVKRLSDEFNRAREKKNPRDGNRELSPIVGLSIATISHLETGKVKAYGLDTLLKVSEYIGKSLDQILGLLPPEDERELRVAVAAARIVRDELDPKLAKAGKPLVQMAEHGPKHVETAETSAKATASRVRRTRKKRRSG